MSPRREIVSRAFNDGSAGTGYVSSIFADDMKGEIVGHTVEPAK